ncbi:XrtA/PEP-CTERM system exopolysaccharide export protein [Psychrobium sp. 1_MG-2023]|uniref:XrtA/PEP-CTERM system exopolysaccharide export protein n=1 Tax=Psychrobium sp. 1_MG-2023 TaxID=3062624 RepID=UPI000C349BDF|nr:XrtA/PEP-CTERM system exopolysaccharide export protein [Psychrobium sp. 1_MG-2023]MDP2561123.1 polysaccharide export protein [Psychrobium sp. 1_MG-2023]PKF55099.1 sugar ABC transporter substrate-binding protein [Alteromonadales bacterium alter-6D02]
MNKKHFGITKLIIASNLTLTLLTGCSNLPLLSNATTYPSLTTSVDNYQYLIGPGDSLNIFVWRNPEVSGQFLVRPDGKITTSLVEDIPVSGKTPTMLARDIEKELSRFIREPIVTVTVSNFVGPFSEQIRIVGEAMNPQSINYRQNMTLLDVMVAVGGLTEFANGNQAKLIRVVNNQENTYLILLDDLVKDGDISANADVLPGDIIIIPEAWF